jgi:aspartyl-tRNA(Asn)/glutamyl-tRNA(Gln) amidotransferase subunit A
MLNSSLKQLSTLLEAKKVSSVELTREFLRRVEALNQEYNAFITVNEEMSLDQARAADTMIASGEAHPLTGIPIAHKDIFCTKGWLTTCGSKMLSSFISPYDAHVIERFNMTGTVNIGKTNMDEFAMGSSNETSFYGPVKNPWDITTVPGGSSGGSACAVAARMAPAATGTDTGGSILQPAALCGVSGIKPTYGLVSRYGMIAFASSLDQGGAIAKSAADLALMLNVMVGFDARDSTSADQAVPAYSKMLDESLAGKTIGVPREYFDDGLDPGCERAIRDALDVFVDLGAKITELTLPHLALSVPTYYIVAPAECSSNLSRYDGIRFGYRHPDASDIGELYTRSRQEGFGAEVKRRIMTGTYVLSAGYYDAYYLQAQKVRRLISDELMRCFEDVDIVAGPTTPTPAFGLGEKIDDPVQMYLNDIYTIAVNLAGAPGISIPCGFSGALPVGLQLIGPHFGEATLLNFAHHYQQQTDWHTKTPALALNDGADK